MGIIKIFRNGDMTFVQAVSGLPFVEEDWMKERKTFSHIPKQTRYKTNQENNANGKKQ